MITSNSDYYCGFSPKRCEDAEIKNQTPIRHVQMTL